MPVYTEEMTKEELEKILDEYRDKNVRFEVELDACKKNLAMAMSREDLYIRTINNLSKALENLAKEKA